MFREMRRAQQQLPQSEALDILRAGSSGVLAVHGDDDYPYAVPLSYAYKEGSLFFHCAPTGHKIDASVRNRKASFCVIADDDVIQSTFTTHYRSSIAFGQLKRLTDLEAKRDALDCLAEKYSPDFLDAARTEIERDLDRVCVLEFTIEHLTGKAAREVVQARAAKAENGS